jgi:hypothetical protein
MVTSLQKLISYRRNCCNQTNEKEVYQVGLVYQPERDLVLDEAESSKYSLVV